MGGIELSERLAEALGGVFEVRRARTDGGARGAHGPGGNERVMTVEMEPDPAERGANGAGAIGGDLERVGAAKIDRDSGGRVDDELRGTSPDVGVDGAEIELNAFVAGAGLEEAKARIGIDLNFAEVVFGKRGAGNGVGDESLADMEFGCGVAAGEDARANLRRALEIGNVPACVGVRRGDGGTESEEEADAESQKNDGCSSEARKPGECNEQAEGLGWRGGR